MPHVFDSGRSSTMRRAIRDEVVEALQPLGKQAGLYSLGVVRFPALYSPGDTEAESMLQEAVQGRAPVFAVALGEQQFNRTGAHDQRWTGLLEIAVYAIARHSNSEQAAIQGTPTSDANTALAPGIEVMLEHALERLEGLILTATGSPLRPKNEDLVFFSPSWVVWEQRYELEVTYLVNHDRSSTTLLTEVLASMNIDNGGTANPVAQTLTEIP